MNFHYWCSKCALLCLKRQYSAADYLLRQDYWRLVAHTARPTFPELAYYSGVLNGNGNMANLRFFWGTPRSICYFICTLSGCGSGNRTRNIAVYTWRLLSYGRHPNIRWWRIKKAKNWPAPRSEANTWWKALLLTHLSFRWTTFNYVSYDHMLVRT
jgi:hypothetical protein